MEVRKLDEKKSDRYQRYVAYLEKELEILHSLSERARQKGVDPSLEPECVIAHDIAGLVEGLVGPQGVASSIREFSSKLPREELAFKIAEEIVYGKFGHLEPKAAAEQAIRTALAIFTEGLTAAPIQGIAEVKIKVNSDHTRYLAIYFAGPIRSAGGTDQALTLVVGDFVRRLLGLESYRIMEEEISRFIEELRIYERSVTRFQYHVSDQELRRALESLPVEVTGTESDPIEVSSFRNLFRIETNRVRGGALRVVNDGIVGRASKVSAIIEKLGLQGWDWLKEFEKKSEKKSTGFMDDVIAGRPVFSFPSRRGGFRLRYGRSCNTGLSAVGVHPATMLILREFLAGGTQMRIELPGKGGVAVPVDSIEGPIARLRDGSVIRVSTKDFSEVKDRIDKILFIGDMLVSYGDFLYNSKKLTPSGYVEEWWVQDLQRCLLRDFKSIDAMAEFVGIPSERLDTLLRNPFSVKPNAFEAISISSATKTPLHPSFTFFWANLSSNSEIELLRAWLLNSRIQIEDDVVREITGYANADVKHAMEAIRLPHKMLDGKITIDGDDAHAFATSLGMTNSCYTTSETGKTVLENICSLSGLELKEKAPTYVGARMGRPEKAKRREMKPLVHVLFPVGLAGGSQRNIVSADGGGQTSIDLVRRKCRICGTYTWRVKCSICGSETSIEKSCPQCGRPVKRDECLVCKVLAKPYQKQVVNFRGMLESACKSLNVSIPKVLKGVKGLTNETKTPEIIEKGILRARHDLSVYKDGTIRFDATNAPLTHFKPNELSVKVERLRKMDYDTDIFGEDLTRDDQICELKLQDVVIPIKSAEYFVREATFLDELLEKVYNIPPFYRVKNIDDLVGHLMVGLAPHTCVGILGRIIGFTDLSVCYAHPIWHSAKRRDCDGDEDTIMLLLDTLINFSREYLPAQIGGIMDAPLLLIPIVNTKEVQRQAHDFDIADRYPIEFYEKTLERIEARIAGKLIDVVGARLGTEAQFEGFRFTVPVSNINSGIHESMYKRLKTMTEKLESQLELAEKLEAVDARRVALKVLTKHFMRDISGNLRAFSTQGFRCKRCNRKFRRPPASGRCTSCGQQLTATVYRKGIEKYLQAAENLTEKYHLPRYYSQRLSLIEAEIDRLFDNRKPRQFSLVDFA